MSTQLFRILSKSCGGKIMEKQKYKILRLNAFGIATEKTVVNKDLLLYDK